MWKNRGMRLSLKAILIVTHYRILTFGISDRENITATSLSILQATAFTERKKGLGCLKRLSVALITPQRRTVICRSHADSCYHCAFYFHLPSLALLMF